MKQGKQLTIFSAFCTILFSINVFAESGVPVIPLQGTNVIVTVGGKQKTYFRLTKTNSLKFQVDGPGKIIVRSRLSLAKNSKSIESYTIRIMDGRKLVKEHTSKTGRSEAAYNIPDFIPAKIRKFSFIVPENSHLYEVFLENTELSEAAVKFEFVSSTPGMEKNLVGMEPLSFDRVVHLTEGDKVIPYYVSSGERKVDLRLVGPTKLKIRSRLNYDVNMSGTQTYTLTISEEGKKVIQKTFATTPTLAMTYQDWQGIVPGVLNTFFLKVPPGEHMFSFALEGTRGQTVSLKLSIPQKDTGNRE